MKPATSASTLAVLGCALAFAGCGSATASAGDARSSHDPDRADDVVVVELEDGTRCATIVVGSGGGIDCDWRADR